MKINRIADSAYKPESVDVREPKVKDLVYAEQISGATSGFKFLCAVVASCCKFDGETKVMEDIEALGMADFLTLTDELGLNGREISPGTSSISSGKEDGEKIE